MRQMSRLKIHNQYKDYRGPGFVKCKQPGCNRKARCRDYCVMHYNKKIYEKNKKEEE